LGGIAAEREEIVEHRPSGANQNKATNHAAFFKKCERSKPNQKYHMAIHSSAAPMISGNSRIFTITAESGVSPLTLATEMATCTPMSVATSARVKIAQAR
jgi:hypothetical protein